MYKAGRKVIASLLVFILTMAHLSTLGEAIASSLEAQTTKTNVANIEFDVYFKQGEAKVHSDTKTIGAENYIYAAIQVKNEGYLKNAQIQLQDPNFKVSEELTTEQISKVDGNKIQLNKIENGQATEIEIPISMIETTGTISASQFNKQSNVKLTGTYVDGEGKEKAVEKDIAINLGWTAEVQAQINLQTTKYIPYEINGRSMILVQTLISSQIVDNILPVKESIIEIDFPTINGNKPREVKVLANSTKATNGDETGSNFTEENYTYERNIQNDTTTGSIENSNTARLTINLKNDVDEEGKVAWEKDAKDEFVVTCIYSAEPEYSIYETNTTANEVEEEFVEIPTPIVPIGATIKARNTITVYGTSEQKVESNTSSRLNLKTQMGELVDFSISATSSSISKGQIYANYDAANKIETEYEQIVTTEVATKSDIKNIILDLTVDSFIKPEATEYKIQQSYYKKVTIDEKELKTVLGESGEVIFYNGITEIAKINSETQANAEGKYVVDLSSFNINTLKIQTSKPQSQGKINFNIVKAIKADTGYTKEQMINFKTLQLNLSGQLEYEGNDETGEVGAITAKNYTGNISLTEPTTQAELVIENNSLTTLALNENVKFKAILKTDDLNCMLYENPTLQIVFPKYIEKFDIKNVEVLFGAEGSNLTINENKIQLIRNQDETKTLSIELEGKQTAYMLGAVSKGINVVITLDITVNKFTASMEDQITMLYTNKNELDDGQAKQAQAGIKVVAPVGMVTTTTISHYAENKEPVTVVSGETQTVEIDTQAAAKNVEFEMNVINNYNNTIENVAILGRTPFKGNKDIVTGQDLGSTIDMPLTNHITVSNINGSKVKVYYSENAEATKDLNNNANGWTLTPANLVNVKSYLIVVTDVRMNTAEGLSFEYTAQIPENLDYNQSAYQAYVVYFNNNLAEGTIEDKQVATKLGVSTGTGAILEGTMQSNIEETQEVLAGDIIKYTLTVKNTGTKSAENVVATIDVPTYFDYIEEDKTSSLGYKYVYLEESKLKLNLETIGVGQEITKEIWLKAIYITEDTINTEIKAKITGDNIKEIETNTVKNIIKKAYYITSATASASNSYIIKENATYKFLYTLRSTEEEGSRDNTVVTILLPAQLDYKAIKLTKYNEIKREDEDITSEAKVEFNSSSRELTINIGEVDGTYGKKLEIETRVGKLPENVYKQNIIIQANVKGDNISKENIKTIEETINKAGLVVTQTSSIPSGTRIAGGEDFKYIVEVENLSSIVMNNVTLTDYLPKQLIYKSTKVTYENGLTTTTTKVTEEGYPIIKLNLEANSNAKIEIAVVANMVEEDTKIENKLKVEHEDIETIETNTINHIIEKYNKPITSDPSEEETTKRIMGQVWIDENNDGIKEEKETKVPDVEMLLFNNETGSLATDSNGNILKNTTDENGAYTFAGIKKGKYTVIFLYDTANYSATTYRKENVNDSVNSDAIDTQITLDGVTKVAAITEEVAITDSNIYNIDLGLVSNPKFDLKLDKTVSKITVQDANGTNSYEFNDTKLAKKDLVGKQIAGTTIIVEYKIKVTNEGAISGFVKKIADYMPTEMKFNSELNKDWYTSGNEVLYNSSLANTIINPGESKEVTLTLTKKMTENNLGTYHNEAEIYEAYNDLGIEDIDSIEGNKLSNEDDISSADVVITVKTGEVILFIGLTLTTIVALVIGAYFIKKKVLK